MGLHTWETVLAALMIGAAVFSLVARIGRGRAFGVAVLFAGIAFVGLATLAPRESHVDPGVSNRPVETDGDGFVSSDTCRSCHPHEYAAWHGSYHRTMTQVATPASVVGSFGETFELYGATYRLERRGDQFWVETDEGAGSRRRIVMTTGSHHMQIYWAEAGNGRLVTALPLLYLIDRQQWIPRPAAFLAPPSRASAAGPRWNTTCIRCHSTHGQQRRNELNEFDTRVAEFGIACEACHGPAEEHVRLNRNPQRRYRRHRTGDADLTVVQPERLTARPSSQVCGQCHGIHYFYTPEDMARWNERGYAYRPGEDLSRTQLIAQHSPDLHGSEMEEILRAYPQYKKEDRFWSDGMVRVSGRDYNGLIESPCYRGGEFTCLSCHTMHKPENDPRPLSAWADDQLGLGMDGDEACLPCHEKFRGEVEKHTFHKAESTGSLCYNCHMPHTVYGLLGAIRSHQVDSPTVQASLETGRPNACNQCHLDKTLAWTAGHLEEWYETAPPELTDEERFIAASVLWSLRGDAGQRALMAWSLGWEPARLASGTTWMAPYLAQLLVDDYDAIRLIAARSLETLPGFAELQLDVFAPRETRTEAGRQVLRLWRERSIDAAAPPDPSVLIDPDGNLREDLVVRLLGQRDHRPVVLKE